MADLPFLAPIPGTRLDPPPKDLAAVAARLQSRSALLGLGYRAMMRFGHANATLLAAGTTYYLFLAVFALTALAFGIASLLGAEMMVTVINDALNQMFPGLLGESGIDAANLEAIGQSTSIVGLVVLLYSGGGAIQAAKTALHQIYGVAKDARNFVVSRLILTGWMLVVAPLILLSFAPTVLVRLFTAPILERLHIGSSGELGLGFLALVVSFALDFLVLYLLLGTLGGVRPARRPRVVGSLAGSVGIEVLKYLAGAIIAASVRNPRYGALAAPIAALLMLYLQCVILYAAAALTAAVASGPGSPSPAPPADAK